MQQQCIPKHNSHVFALRLLILTIFLPYLILFENQPFLNMAKKKQEIFKKLKIKAGKKIPKHLNETKPEFTAKKIQVKPFAKSSPSDFVRLLSSASLNTNLKMVYLTKLNQQL